MIKDNIQQMNQYKGHLIVESYLKNKKRRPNNKSKISLRYFKFNLKEKTFSFKDSKENSEIKVIHIGKDIKGFEDKLDQSEINICDWIFGFKVITSVRTYVLYAENKDVYIKWIGVLNYHFNKTELLNSNVHFAVYENVEEYVDVKEFRKNGSKK